MSDNKLKDSIKKHGGLVAAYHWLNNGMYCLATVLSPRLNSCMRYKKLFGKKLDLKNPQTLNEKILWLKLNRYMHDPLVIQCADKVAVREYVKKCDCEEILTNVIGIYETAKDIPWGNLPSQFVLKWNFGATMNIVCTDKSRMDGKAVIKQMDEWGKNKYWLPHSEMQYKYIPRKIICEELLDDTTGGECIIPDKDKTWTAPKDYKVYCFNGKPRYIMVCVGREKGNHPKFYFFDNNWKLARINKDSINAPENFTIPEPQCLDKLLACAERLAQPFPFVRADFYICNNHVYFGELTFTPAAGLDANRLHETDVLMGGLVDLNYR